MSHFKIPTYWLTLISTDGVRVDPTGVFCLAFNRFRRYCRKVLWHCQEVYGQMTYMLSFNKIYYIYFTESDLFWGPNGPHKLFVFSMLFPDALKVGWKCSHTVIANSKPYTFTFAVCHILWCSGFVSIQLLVNTTRQRLSNLNILYAFSL